MGRPRHVKAFGLNVSERGTRGASLGQLTLPARLTFLGVARGGNLGQLTLPARLTFLGVARGGEPRAAYAARSPDVPWRGTRGGTSGSLRCPLA